MTSYVSQSQYGKIEDFNLQIARGQIQGHTGLIIFGYNPDVDTTIESVWPDGGVVPHPTVASVLKISSSSANDTSAGTGARTVYIEGLDSNYNVISETVTLDWPNGCKHSRLIPVCQSVLCHFSRLKRP